MANRRQVFNFSSADRRYSPFFKIAFCDVKQPARSESTLTESVAGLPRLFNQLNNSTVFAFPFQFAINPSPVPRNRSHAPILTTIGRK